MAHAVAGVVAAEQQREIVLFFKVTDAVTVVVTAKHERQVADSRSGSGSDSDEGTVVVADEPIIAGGIDCNVTVVVTAKYEYERQVADSRSGSSTATDTFAAHQRRQPCRCRYRTDSGSRSSAATDTVAAHQKRQSTVSRKGSGSDRDEVTVVDADEQIIAGDSGCNVAVVVAAKYKRQIIIVGNGNFTGVSTRGGGRSDVTAAAGAIS
jgi:hypothetical protein